MERLWFQVQFFSIKLIFYVISIFRNYANFYLLRIFLIGKFPNFKFSFQNVNHILQKSQNSVQKMEIVVDADHEVQAGIDSNEITVEDPEVVLRK